jgi:hypothetical protein
VFHRHLSLEKLELTRELNPDRAQRLASRANRCWQCSANLSHSNELSSALSLWSLPAGAGDPADWRPALRRAIAPGRTVGSRSIPGAAGGRRLWMAGLTVAALAVAFAVPAAASADAGSIFYPLRGAEESAIWAVTPAAERPRLEAELAAGYLWQARSSAGRHDTQAYRAAMDRFFLWGDRLKRDISASAPGELPAIRATVSTASSLLAQPSGSGTDAGRDGQAQQVLNDVQAQDGNGEHQGSN